MPIDRETLQLAGEYYLTSIPDDWTNEMTGRFCRYLDEHHNSESEAPAFGFVREGMIYCEDHAALTAAFNFATE